jgi:hypothetical protein
VRPSRLKSPADLFLVGVGAAFDASPRAGHPLAMEILMAILRSLDGKFYEIPDELVSIYLIPADKVKERLSSTGADLDELNDDSLRSVTGGGTSQPASEWHNVWQNRATGF